MKASMGTGDVGIAVEVHGKCIEEFAGPDGQTYIWAKTGTEYGIVAWNFTSNRVEVVVTVDGLNILDGNVGDWRTQPGYVIGAHTKPAAIPGFRLDDKTVAAFRFGGVDKSYAARIGEPANIGVIGAAFFKEDRPKHIFPLMPPVYRGASEGLGSFGYESRTLRGPSVGTEFGRTVSHQVGSTSFNRMNLSPDATLALQYRSEEELKALGIDVRHKNPPVAVARPNPFPGVQQGCVPPAGWDPRFGTR